MIVLQDLYRWEQQGVDADGRVVGEHRATGLRPKCLDRLLEQGVEVPASLFGTTRVR